MAFDQQQDPVGRKREHVGPVGDDDGSCGLALQLLERLHQRGVAVLVEVWSFGSSSTMELRVRVQRARQPDALALPGEITLPMRRGVVALGLA